MYETNRSAFLLIPREPFLHWLESAGISGMTLEELQSDANAYLTDPCDNADGIWKIVESRAAELFAAELADWCADESLWPDLHPDIFASWFDIRPAAVVTDLSAAPFEREAFRPLEP
ncbi:Uncharacterised protein [Kingella potus]|uniref:VacJ n=1 Tax=Kingella potus TaxID=265175 RepID=A0A377R0P0_9NEIS|nr:VacJ [Kingella potus]UOP01920.1 VacJ [Kingella potus]STR02440.1 Uncharacterised protein [Kingella potus]